MASHRRHTATLLLESAGIFVICIYGGYFGAAAGVLLLAMLLRAGGATLAHANAGKNVILGVANVVAAVVCVSGTGAVVGGDTARCLVVSSDRAWVPIVVRHAPTGPMTLVIGAAGLALAVKLGVDAYG